MHGSLRKRRWPWITGLVLLFLVLVLRFGNTLAIALETERPSRSIGTPDQGALMDGKRLPSRGDNFRVYSDLGALLGRNAVDDRVRSTVLDAYATLALERPGKVFVYGETGWPEGGRFAPHRTHQNGMAVDFFVPVLDRRDRSRPLPTHAFNRFGYDLEFSDKGRWQELRIDNAALAGHLKALAAAATRHGLRVQRVIYDPSLQPALFASEDGADLPRRLAFSRGRTWVRHDEHYHVVFARLD